MNCLESQTIAGDSPVTENLSSLTRFLSTTGHVQSSRNPRRPFRKAKYYSVTDSEQVPRGKGEKNPEQGSEIDSEMVCLQAVEEQWP